MKPTATAAPAHPPVLAPLEWPMPPHFKIVREPILHAPEHGIAVLNDGRNLVVNVVSVDESAAVLEFTPGQGPTTLMINFSVLKSLCLSRMIELEHVALTVPSEHVAENP